MRILRDWFANVYWWEIPISLVPTVGIWWTMWYYANHSEYVVWWMWVLAWTVTLIGVLSFVDRLRKFRKQMPKIGL